MMAAKQNGTDTEAVEESGPVLQPINNPVAEEQSPATIADIPSEESKPGLPVAGVGASAAGLDAFKKFFTAMPQNSGVGFVLIPHLLGREFLSPAENGVVPFSIYCWPGWFLSRSFIRKARSEKGEKSVG